MIIKPKIFEKFSEIAAGQSTRLGGNSLTPYLSMNLGKSVGDDPDTVEQNRALFFGNLGFDKSKVVFSHQVHGAEVLKVLEPGNFSGFDAQTTNVNGICLAVSIADCCPILIYDKKNKAIAAIHAGWRGTVNQIIIHTLVEMNKNFGTVGFDCFAYIGACISDQNFEVGIDVADNFEDTFKVYDKVKRKFFVNLKEANKAQLKSFGIPENQIEISEYCTVAHNELFFSHRKENGITGRMMAGIGLIENKKE